MVPADIDDSIRTDLTMQKVAKFYGADLQTAAGQAVVVKVLQGTSDKLGIDVNPRYGSWNSKKLTLDTATDPWLKTVTTA
jgi:hypothetical protein